MSKYVKLTVLEPNGLYGKMKGLMFAKKSKNIILKTRFGIHTFFLKFPIDVIVCDRKYVVKKIKTGLIPNRIFFWNPAYDNVIEAKMGTVKRKKIKIGSKLELNY